MEKPLVYNWPRDIGVSSVTIFPISAAVASRSRYTGATRAAVGGNSYWMATVRLRRVSEDKWRRLRPFIAKLDGARNQVRLFDPASIFPRGAAAGVNMSNYSEQGSTPFSDDTPFADGTFFAEGAKTCRLARTHRRGENVVLLKGLKPSQEIAFDADDQFEIGGFLHIATARVRSNAEGMALVPIAPSLRVDIPISDPKALVKLAFASSPFVLATPYQGFEVRYRNFADDISLDFVEVLP